jgi:RsmE family RNA methyltransferase
MQSMNIVLFDEDEMDGSRPLGRRDERTIHLLKVLHKKVGDSFDAGVLGGKMGKGTILSQRLDGSISYRLSLDEDPPPRAPLRLGLGFPRPIQLKRILRDAASLGLQAVDIFGLDLGEKSYRDTNFLRDGGSREALLEGAMQARDTRLPELNTYDTLDAWLERHIWEDNRRPYGTGPLLIAPDNVNPESSLALLSARAGQSAVVAIGSERGWSERERKLLEDSGFLRLSMGKRALRTETACVAASTLVLEKIGILV